MDTVLAMLKNDLGVTHEKRDIYLTNLILSSKEDLLRQGVQIDVSKIEDIMLLSDFCAWIYRNRTENVAMSINLKRRIRDIKVKGRVSIEES